MGDSGVVGGWGESCWLLAVGLWLVLGIGYWVLGIGCWGG